jgi:hypothetical protein
LQYEPEVREHSKAILDKIWSSYIVLGPKQTGECQPFSATAKSVTPSSLRIESDDVSFSADFVIGEWPHSYAIRPRIHFSLERNFDNPFRVPPGKGRGVVFKELWLEGIGATPWGREAPQPVVPVRCLFPTFYDERLPRDVALLDLPVPLDEDLHDLASELRGIPRSNSAGIVRMLYLSASTITTAGFGDIVPLTTRARGLVTTESIVGVVLIGLFLNAIAKRV